MQVLIAENKLPKQMAVARVQRQQIVNEIEQILKANDIDATLEKSSKGNAQELEQKQQIESCCKTTTITTTAIAKLTPEACTPYPGVSQVLPTLFLCGAGAAMPDTLDKLQVRFIINVAPELPDTPLSTKSKPLYLRINAVDRPGVDLAAHFDEVADMIEEVRQHGGKSLVHCVAGVSRSASLCLAYLMKHCDMSLREAYLHTKAIRPQIRPNSGFFQQLRQYEEKLRGTCSVKMIFFESLNKEIPDLLEPEYRSMEDFYQRQRKALKRH